MGPSPVTRFRTSLGFLQDRNDLLVAESLLLHVRLSLRLADSTSEPHYFRGARQQLAFAFRSQANWRAEAGASWHARPAAQQAGGCSCHAADPPCPRSLQQLQFLPQLLIANVV